MRTDTKLQDLLASIRPEYHAAFLRFVDSGEAAPEFLSYLDRDADCQRAVEDALELETAGFRGLANELRADWERLQASAPVGGGPASLESQLVETLRRVARSAPETRREIVAGTARLLGNDDGKAAAVLDDLSARLRPKPR